MAWQEVVNIFLVKRPKLGLIELDASVRELHQESAEMTDNPVEAGVDMTDHYRDLPKRVQIEGVVSQLIDPVRIRSAADLLNVTRHIDAWEALVALKESHERFTLVTSLAVYTNMMFENGPSAIRDLENTNVLRFTATLREVQVAFTSLAEAIAAEVADTASAAAARGTQGAAGASPGEASQATGVL